MESAEKKSMSRMMELLEEDEGAEGPLLTQAHEAVSRIEVAEREANAWVEKIAAAGPEATEAEIKMARAAAAHAAMAYTDLLAIFGFEGEGVT